MDVRLNGINLKIFYFVLQREIKFFERNCKTIFFIALLKIIGLNAYAQQTSSCERAYMIVKTAEKFHFQPREVNDEFSKLLFPSFINGLDPDGIILSKNDVEELEKDQLKIDEEILNKQCAFIDKAIVLYKKKVMFIDSLVQSLSLRKLDFEEPDTLSYNDSEKYLSQKQLIKRWERLIKFQILSTYLSREDSSKQKVKPSLSELNEIKKEIINREVCKIKSKSNISGGIGAFVAAKFLEAVSFSFDPHTIYFTPVEEDEFNKMISKENLSYGFEIAKNELGEIEINAIIPGSPAWNSNALNEGDVILDVKSIDGDLKSFDCLSMNEVSHFLSSESLNEAYFHVRKKSGKEVHIHLKKEKINVEENAIRSFILKGDQNIGYIYLPSFYAENDEVNQLIPNGCANDIARELIKLKREGIDGLVVDLRNNGGGSMLEALRMAGIFINYGALSIIDSRDEEPSTLKDMNRGTIYNDPLVVLVNSFSASASELFSAAMQDYNRGIILGSTTYGKSTAQEIIPLDAYKYSQAELANASGDLGYLKITMGEFYRVTGKSHQKLGVQPDIEIPDLYDALDIKESSNLSALDFSSIDKKTYYSPLSKLPIEMLKSKSSNRTKNDSIFNCISELAVVLAKDQKEYSVPLSYNGLYDFFNVNALVNRYERLQSKRGAVFSVKNPSYLEGISDAKDAEKELNENVMNEIEKDVHIQEAFYVIGDLINWNKN